MTIQTANMLVRLRATSTGTNDFGGPVFSPEMEVLLDLTTGTAANQADLLWMDERTVTTGANDDLDLAGVLTTAFGATLTAAELVAVFIINKPRTGAANTTNLTVGGGSNPVTTFMAGTTPTFGPIRPDGFLAFGSPNAAGFGAVTAGTGDILRITNSAGASATYQIAIIARSA